MCLDTETYWNTCNFDIIKNTRTARRLEEFNIEYAEICSAQTRR